MIHALLPDKKDRPLSFYLAMEEFLAARDNGEYFFMWQVPPTVIIGRNQHLLSEVNVDYCSRHGVNIVRRRSGGGCVYADMDNVMFSYITTSATVTTTFSDYTAKVARMLSSMGIRAEAGGRNDILIDGRKVSGNAFYHRRGRAIVHGTMLFNTDIAEMLKAISPSDVKLSSKGVASVRSRVINLSEVTDMYIDEFKKRAAAYMCDSEIMLSPTDISAIEKIEKNYLTREWLEGKTSAQSSRSPVRIDGVGEFLVSLSLRGNTIDRISLSGDFFLLSDLDMGLLDHLRGVEYSRDAVLESLAGIEVEKVIAGLDRQQLVNLIFGM